LPDLIKNPLRITGACKSEHPLNDLLLDSLIFREGCSTFLKWDSGGYFIGGTRDNNCPSDIRGAAYAASQVTIERYCFISWDRGFAASGKQLRGVENGLDIFIKMP
jgi:CpeT protein